MRIDPGWDPTAGFFQGRLLPVLFTSGALTNPVLFNTVVQHCFLAIDRDHIAVGLSFESPPIYITFNKNFGRLA